MRRLVLVTSLLALAVPGHAANAAAATPGAREPFPLGRLIEGVACRRDPTQTYTLYLPTTYSPERRFPALLIFDPRGRSVQAAELFREAAETYGWILLSSNDTRSDGPIEPNVKAINALWPEVHERYATDGRRIYASGFSGGGMVAWELGRQAKGGLAGVIASGARWDPEHFRQRYEVSTFGAAGDTDFNYLPMRDVQAQLETWGTPNRLEIFAGPHQWMPASLAREAVEWMEMQAMREQRRPVDTALVARLLAADRARAEELAAAGRPLDALRRFEAIAAGYSGLAQVGGAQQRVAELRGDPQTRRAQEQEERWDHYARLYLTALSQALAPLVNREPVVAGRLRRDLRLDELAKHAAAPGYEGVVGRRMLNHVNSQLGFYVLRELFARQDWRTAETVLALATEIDPQRADLWYNRACAAARAGERQAALAHLERAIATGYRDAAAMAADPDLESLRGDEAFLALVRSLPAAASPKAE